jgi:acyl carrier protein
MTDQEKIQFVERAILTVFKKEVQLTEETDLKDVGLDSLEIVELQMFYEDELKVEMPDTTDPVHTVKDLMKLMA